MGVIQCCGALQKAKSYILQPYGGFLDVRMDWLESCKYCSHTIIQVTRLDYNNHISVIRKTNRKARKLREKLDCDIISEIKENRNFSLPPQGGRFYLYYNEYGQKKKCFSNLSCLKIGLGENIGYITKTTLKSI